MTVVQSDEGKGDQGGWRALGPGLPTPPPPPLLAQRIAAMPRRVQGGGADGDRCAVDLARQAAARLPLRAGPAGDRTTAGDGRNNRSDLAAARAAAEAAGVTVNKVSPS